MLFSKIHHLIDNFCLILALPETSNKTEKNSYERKREKRKSCNILPVNPAKVGGKRVG